MSILRTSIGCHDEYDMAEVGFLSLVVGESRIVHHLQHYIIYVRMSLLYLVEQEHAVWGLANGIGEQTSVFVSHIARRRADELRHGVLLGVFRHVESHQLYAKFLCQHLAHLGLAHTSRAHKEQ